MRQKLEGEKRRRNIVAQGVKMCSTNPKTLNEDMKGETGRKNLFGRMK